MLADIESKAFTARRYRKSTKSAGKGKIKSFTTEGTEGTEVFTEEVNFERAGRPLPHSLGCLGFSCQVGFGYAVVPGELVFIEEAPGVAQA